MNISTNVWRIVNEKTKRNTIFMIISIILTGCVEDNWF